jgi:outer membrane protein OmpA-like peptidoglycan-associated protein
MMPPRAMLIVCIGLSMFVGACATKDYVRDQVTASEAKVSEQLQSQESKLQDQEAKLRETANAAASRQALDATAQKVQGLDARIGEVDVAASDAQTRAERAADVARDSEARLSQRIADRNKYRLVQTRSIYYESGRADIKDAGVAELEAVAKALEADPNALVELQGFADPRGADRYNDELARERVEGAIRHLVRRGIELRQIRSIAMGKVMLAAGEKPTADTLAEARRVEIRLLTPWSSWEDTQAGLDRGANPVDGSANPPPPSALPRESVPGLRAPSPR